MATLGEDKLTLVDLLKRQDPDGGLADIAEVMEQDQEILLDIPWVEANATIGHRSTIRTGQPTGTYRKLNAGVPNEKATTVAITDVTASLETYLECDKDLADISGDVNKFRLDESSAAIEGLSQTLASTVFYGDTDVDEEKFLGLAGRYDSLSAGNAANIINEGDSSTLSSMWLVNWSPQTVFGIYPQGTQAGMKHEDKGQVTLQDSNGDNYEGYRSHLAWKAGIVVRDWRHIVRVANIDSTAMVIDAATGPNIIDLMTRAIEQIKSLNGNPAFYVTKNIRSYLRRQINNHSNMNLSLENFAGKRVLMFDGIPVRKTDALTATETAVA